MIATCNHGVTCNHGPVPLSLTIIILGLREFDTLRAFSEEMTHALCCQAGPLVPTLRVGTYSSDASRRGDRNILSHKQLCWRKDAKCRNELLDESSCWMGSANVYRRNDACPLLPSRMVLSMPIEHFQMQISFISCHPCSSLRYLGERQIRIYHPSPNAVKDFRPRGQRRPHELARAVKQVAS